MEEGSSQGSVQLEIYFEAFITSGLLRDPVCHAGDREGVRPWPRPLPAGRGPDGADNRTPDDEAGKEKHFSPLMAGVLLLARARKGSQPHGVQGAERPSHYARVQRRHQTWVLLVHCHPNHAPNNLSPCSQTALGACRCRYNDAKFSTKIAKRGPIRQTKSV